MKRFVTILIFVFCCNSVCIGACSEQIKAFYSAYMNNLLHNDDFKNAVLYKTYLTEELIEKVQRISCATGVNAIIRAQDVNEDAIETVAVKDLGKDWYLVTYLWKKGDNSTLTEIPLKAQEVDGKCKITYITPIWNGSQYGDELLTHRDEKASRIDQTSELSFLKSFYDVYLSQYCVMPKDLNSKLSTLRLHYLSQRALAQFENAELENQQDGFVGYDLLIDNFDFDGMWLKNFKVIHLNENYYQITYSGSDKVYKMGITIKRIDNNYLIDDLGIVLK